MKKIITKSKDILIEFGKKNPGKLLLFLLAALILAGFMTTTTIFFGFENGKLKVNITKEKLDVNKILDKKGK